MRLQLPNGTTTETWEALTFPFQLDGRKNLLDGFFVGGSLTEVSGDGDLDIAAVLAGFIGQITVPLGGPRGDDCRLQVAVGAEVDLEGDDTTVSLGLIDKF